MKLKKKLNSKKSTKFKEKRTDWIGNEFIFFSNSINSIFKK